MNGLPVSINRYPQRNDNRYHVRLMDESGEENALNLLLTERTTLGYQHRLVNPYAAKMSQGDQSDADLTEWSLIGFTDWRGGRGQEKLEDATCWYDSQNLETRIEGQLTLGPLPQLIDNLMPSYNPGNVSWYALGYPGPINGEPGTDYQITYINADNFYAQRIAASTQLACGSAWLTTVELYLAKTGTMDQDLRVSIYSDTGGRPGAELAHATLGDADISTTPGWVTATLVSPCEITAGTRYWLVFTTTQPTTQSYCTWITRVPFLELVWHKQASGTDEWEINSPLTFGRIPHRLAFQRMSRAQSFKVGAADVSCTTAQFYLSKTGTGNPGTFTAMLCSDSTGSPNTASPLKSVNFDASVVTQDGAWYTVTWASAQTLTATNTYWLVLQAPADAGDNFTSLVWGTDTTAGYTDGLAKYDPGTGSWTATGADHYFRINRPELDGTVIKFARYSGKWYCAAGDTVCVWDNTSGWTASEERANKTITDLAVWDGKLYAARGSLDTLREFNGTTWSETTGALNAQMLYNGGGQGGWLHYNLAASKNAIYYIDGDGATHGPIECGSSEYAITGMAWYNDQLMVATPVGLYSFAGDIAYQLLDWRSQEHTDNGKGMVMWPKTNCLYIPLHNGLVRWNGDTSVAVGPEQGTGLPADRSGRVVTLCATGNWLYAGIDAGTSGYSSVLAHDGMHGWHQVYRSWEVGQRLSAVAFETISSPSRLWVAIDKGTRYMKLPDLTDNPYQYTGYNYVSRGSWDSSWIGGDLLDVAKDLHEVIIRAEGVSSSQPIDVWYEVDRSGLWTFLGRATNGTRIVLPFVASGFIRKTTATGCTETTIELASSSTTTDMQPGDWIRIGREVRQIASITDSNTFVLETALTDIPESGEYVEPSRAAGYEFRLHVMLNSTSSTSTPKVTSIGVRYQASVLDRWIWTLQVRVEDNMTDLSGAAYPMDACTLRGQLDEWCTKIAPIVLEDIDGRRYQTKITAAGEGGLTRTQHEDGTTSYSSVYSINLIEV